MLGPYQGSRALGSSAASWSVSRIAIGSQCASSAAPSRWPYFSRAIALISRPVASSAFNAAVSRAKASASVAESVAVSSK